MSDQVRIKFWVEWPGHFETDYVVMDRATWDAMETVEREEIMNDAAVTMLANNGIGYGHDYGPEPD